MAVTVTRRANAHAMQPLETSRALWSNDAGEMMLRCATGRLRAILVRTIPWINQGPSAVPASPDLQPAAALRT
jgi:hypothetical protein